MKAKNAVLIACFALLGVSESTWAHCKPGHFNPGVPCNRGQDEFYLVGLEQPPSVQGTTQQEVASGGAQKKAPKGVGTGSELLQGRSLSGQSAVQDGPKSQVGTASREMGEDWAQSKVAQQLVLQ